LPTYVLVYLTCCRYVQSLSQSNISNQVNKSVSCQKRFNVISDYKHSSFHAKVKQRTQMMTEVSLFSSPLSPVRSNAQGKSQGNKENLPRRCPDSYPPSRHYRRIATGESPFRPVDVDMDAMTGRCLMCALVALHVLYPPLLTSAAFIVTQTIPCKKPH